MASLYHYTARNTDGRFVRGSIEAATLAGAIASLRTRALFVTSLEDAETVRGSIAGIFHTGPVSHKSFVAFFRSFATLLGAGVPIRRSLEVTMEQCADGRLREALGAVLGDVENGLALSEAMSRRPREFRTLFVAMVRAGEIGGVMDEVADRLATLLERERTSRKQLVATLTYPAVVAVSAIALILFLLTSIVPMFEMMYAQLHVPLPPITAILIRTGHALRSPHFLFVGATFFLAALLGFVRAASGSRASEVAHGIALRLPLVGSILRKATTARLARVLGTLLRSGVSLVAALEVSRDVAASAPHRRSIEFVRSALDEGASLSDPLAETRLYEPMFVQLVRVGEETGALDAMLLRVAEYYEVDVETALAALGAALEPVMIIFLGSIVGFIVAAIFIPLYTLIGSIR